MIIKKCIKRIVFLYTIYIYIEYENYNHLFACAVSFVLCARVHECECARACVRVCMHVCARVHVHMSVCTRRVSICVSIRSFTWRCP